MVSLGVSESGCGIKACESFWKKQRGQEEITAGCTVPAPASDEIEVGSRCNQMVYSWLLNSVYTDIASS